MITDLAMPLMLFFGGLPIICVPEVSSTGYSVFGTHESICSCPTSAVADMCPSPSSAWLALAWLDMSTGEFHVQSFDGIRALGQRVEVLAPAEIIFADAGLEDAEFMAAVGSSGAAQSPLPRVRFDSSNANDRLCQAFGVANLDAFGDFSRAEVAAAGAVVDYVVLTQKGSMPRLRPLQQRQSDHSLDIDPASRRVCCTSAACW